MMVTPQGFSARVWQLGPEYVALWQLLELNNNGSVTTTCVELGRHMSGPALDRCKVLRMLKRMESVGVLSLEPAKKRVVIRLGGANAA